MPVTQPRFAGDVATGDPCDASPERRRERLPIAPQPMGRLGRDHRPPHRPGHAVAGGLQQPVEVRRVGLGRAGTRGQREDGVAVDHRVHRVDRPGQAVVADPADLLALRLGQRRVGRERDQGGGQRRRGGARARARRRPSPPRARRGPAAAAAAGRRARQWRAAYSSPVREVDRRPAAFTTASAPTMVPSGRVALDRADAALEPAGPRARPGAVVALGHLARRRVVRRRPEVGSREAARNSHRARGRRSPRPGTTGTRSSEPGSPTSKPTASSSSRWTTPSTAASPSADPPVNTSACTRSTRLRGSSRSVSRVPGPPPRTSTPGHRALGRRQHDGDAAEPAVADALGLADPDAGDVGDRPASSARPSQLGERRAQRVEADRAEVERRRGGTRAGRSRRRAAPAASARASQPDPLADLVRRRLARPAEVAVAPRTRASRRPSASAAA